MERKDQRDWKLPAFGEFCPSPTDWAQMASYIDGEGSVLINPRAGRRNSGEYTTLASTFYLKLTVANTDVRLMVWLKERFGGTYKDANTEKYYEGKNWKRAYHWSASSQQAAWILHNCLPYFVMKREQAEIGIALQDSMKRFVRGTGSKVLPEEIVSERRELKRRLLVLKAKGKVMEPAQAQRIAEVS
jgi:hypothetical protein